MKNEEEKADQRVYAVVSEKERHRLPRILLPPARDWA